MGKNKIKIQQFQKRKRSEEQKDVEIKKLIVHSFQRKGNLARM
jgi:hypothetical protein